ncbi:Na+ H+ antiporter NhaC-like protein [Paucilactobacillus oligofermentans DSM 15707 = LMG 22743]|uniref:Na+ H+ antiporter NhaC-like protein n=1 Tax=Paucilactobacillus oligofermentans DSM 15707 = LMG 22743 TaxID=1423778 RepID=A0A0R1RLM5_9LACO|nr:hypothetical protein [Paucilactobacillus oligofermentans]KRL57734.1 Na+ H+ antiporter NhaC-like protein [Paucilactobacillus oligofermentans DSM 15707 = LMG 22743]
MLTSFLCKNRKQYWQTTINGLANPGIAKLIFVFLIIGIFTKLLIVGKTGEGFVWLGLTLNLHGGSFAVLAFCGTAIFSLGSGVPFAALFAATTVFYVPGVLLGVNPAIMVGTIIGGVFFGDGVSPNSQLTTAVLQMETHSITGKSADLVKMLRQQVKWVCCVAAVTIIYLFLFASKNSTTQSSTILNKFANPAGMWMLIPVIVVAIMCIKTRDIIASLTTGIFVGLFVGIFSGLFSFSDIITLNAKSATVTGIFADGISSMLTISTSTIFLSGSIEIMQKSGVITLFSDWLTSKKFIQTPIGAEIVTGLGMGMVSIFQCGALLPGILLYGDLANRIGHTSKISPERRSYMLVAISMSITGILPINSIFIMGILGQIRSLNAEFSSISVPSANSIFFSTLYCWIMTILCLCWIIFGWGRSFETNPKSNLIEDKVSN